MKNQKTQKPQQHRKCKDHAKTPQNTKPQKPQKHKKQKNIQ